MIAIKTTSAWLVATLEPSHIVCGCLADEDIAIYREALAN